MFVQGLNFGIGLVQEMTHGALVLWALADLMMTELLFGRKYSKIRLKIEIL